MVNAEILRTSFYAPEKILDNDFFVENGPYRVYKGADEKGEPIWKEKDGRILLVDTPHEKIEANTGGILERRVVAGDEFHIDMIAKAFERTGFDAQKIDTIRIATVTDPTRYPSVAARTQRKIGARDVISNAYDVVAACSGFTHALHEAKLNVENDGGYHLVAGIEIMSRMVDYTELNCNLFGDGCGLVILGPTENENEGILATHFANDVRGLDYIFRDKYGKCRMPQGPKVKANAWRGMVNTVYKLVEKADAAQRLIGYPGISKEDVKLYIPHQANGRILDEIEKREGLTGTGKVYRNIARYGNMSSATVPVALASALAEGRAAPGDLVALMDIGSGLALGGALVRITENHRAYKMAA